MESRSPENGKEESPSLESIGHLKSAKRDNESLEDFEDITKDEPSMKDVTAQFLQGETEYINRVKSGESLMQTDVNVEFKQKEDDHKSSDLPTTSGAYGVIEVSEESENDEDSGDSFEPKKSTSVISSDIPKHHLEGSVGNLMDFQETDDQITTPEKHDLKYEEKSDNLGVNISNDNVLVDVLSNDHFGSDDLSNLPKKGESSPPLNSDLDNMLDNILLKKPVSEGKSNESKDTESMFNEPLSKLTSEPGINQKLEPEILQGDGLHMKENVEEDVSDDEEFIPEPIPKDYPEIGAIEGKQFLAAIGLDTWFRPDLLNPKLEGLVYWRDPKKSGVVFGSILVILLSLTKFSLISVVAYTSLTLLAAALVFRIYKNILQAAQKTSEGHPFKTYLATVLNHPTITAVYLTVKEYLDFDLTVNPEKAREISDVVVSYLNKSVSEIRRLFLVEDVIDSVKFGIILWCLTYVGAWFNGLSLIIIAFVGLFTLPKVYENNKTQIDANIDIVKTKINEVTEKIKAVIPMAKKTEEVKDKGE